ncbi:MAG: hypothetical protein V1748_00585 [Actinomycetota bacterium]
MEEFHGQYSYGQPPDQQAGQTTCYHKFITGADGAVYCQKCGAVLSQGTYGTYRTSRDTQLAEPRPRRTVLLVVVGAIVLLAAAGIAAWFYFNKGPAPVASGETAQVIDLGAEPAQGQPAGAVLLATRADGMTINALASYHIAGKVVCVREYAPFGSGSSGFPIDLGLAWGDVGKADYEKYVKLGFSNEYAANQWLMYRYEGDLPWPLPYFESHVSNNHICPASENLYNALMSLKKNDLVLLEGYLAESRDPSGEKVLSSSLTRDDTDAGACESFYVQTLQVGDQVYK